MLFNGYSFCGYPSSFFPFIWTDSKKAKRPIIQILFIFPFISVVRMFSLQNTYFRNQTNHQILIKMFVPSSSSNIHHTLFEKVPINDTLWDYTGVFINLNKKSVPLEEWLLFFSLFQDHTVLVMGDHFVLQDLSLGSLSETQLDNSESNLCLLG